MCRKQHGTAFSTYAEVAAAGFTFVRGAEQVRVYQSSATGERRFCTVCGSKLTFVERSSPQRVWVAAGAFDDEPQRRPGHHIFVGSKAAWYVISDQLPQYDAFPTHA